jgi:hypothetical protein
MTLTVLNDPCSFMDPLGLKETCTINIAIDNGSKLTDQELKMVMAQIQQIFGATKTNYDGN